MAKKKTKVVPKNPKRVSKKSNIKKSKAKVSKGVKKTSIKKVEAKKRKRGRPRKSVVPAKSAKSVFK